MVFSVCKDYIFDKISYMNRFSCLFVLIDDMNPEMNSIQCIACVYLLGSWQNIIVVHIDIPVLILDNIES